LKAGSRTLRDALPRDPARTSKQGAKAGEVEAN